MSEEKLIDWVQVAAQRTGAERVEALDAEIDRVGYVSLTDCFMNRNSGGQIALQLLDPVDQSGNKALPPRSDAAERTWKLQVLCDEWGNKLKPGDVVERKKPKPLKDRTGKRLVGTNELRRQGLFEQKFVDTRKFVLNEKCCITCGYDDAAYFLSQYGVHYKPEGGAICARKELSGGPCKMPDANGQPIPLRNKAGDILYNEKDGTPRFVMKHIWYWRFKEAPPWIYKTLPKFEKKTDTVADSSTSK